MNEEAFLLILNSHTCGDKKCNHKLRNRILKSQIFIQINRCLFFWSLFPLPIIWRFYELTDSQFYCFVQRIWNCQTFDARSQQRKATKLKRNKAIIFYSSKAFLYQQNRQILKLILTANCCSLFNDYISLTCYMTNWPRPSGHFHFVLITSLSYPPPAEGCTFWCHKVTVKLLIKWKSILVLPFTEQFSTKLIFYFFVYRKSNVNTSLSHNIYSWLLKRKKSIKWY